MTLRTYGAGDRLHVQAQRIWLILTAWAHFREKTIEYGELAELMGKNPKAGVTLGRQLGIVGYYCLNNGLPPLNIIVVGQKTGAPGAEAVVTEGKTVRKDQKAVFKTDWFAIRSPSLKDLRETREERKRQLTW